MSSKSKGTPASVKTADAASTCKVCKKLVKDSDKALECEICNDWSHSKCLNLSDTEYEFLGSHRNCHWYCLPCDKNFGKVLAMLAEMKKTNEKTETRMNEITEIVTVVESEIATVNANITELHSKMQDQDLTKNMTLSVDARVIKGLGPLNDEIGELKLKLSEIDTKLETAIEAKLAGCLEGSVKTIVENPLWSGIVAKEVDTQLKQVSSEVNSFQQILDEAKAQSNEEKDRESRSANVILYRVPEAETRDERVIADKAFALELMQEALELGISESDIKAVFRLGKRGQNSRPMIIQFKEKSAKNKLMESLSRLRNAEDKFKRISVTHDLTKREREECKLLVTEAKAKQDSEAGDFLWRVRGPPGQLKVVKLRKHVM